MFSNAINNKYEYLFAADKSANTIHIGYGIDDNYARCMGTSILSICRHNNAAFTFHILAIKLNHTNIDRIKNLARQLNINIIVYEINPAILRELPTFVHLPLPTYFRFILPYILHEEKYIYYIDADIICLNSADKLFSLDLQNNIIAAVPDLDWMNKKRNKALQLKDHTYFNAGVLVINIAVWNNFSVMDKVLAVIKKDPVLFRYLDQDALNVVLHNKVLYLDKIYNCIDPAAVNRNDIVFLHFAAHPKPWNIAWPISSICNDFNRHLYSACEQHTPWKNEVLQMPRNYKEMKVYAKALRHNGNIVKSLGWYIKYLVKKYAG